MYYYLYKTVNKINSNFYIGRRASEFLPDEDEYLGSGKF